MKCSVEVVATPTIDTPGTILAIHFDDKRYLVGNLAEGSQRACLQRGLGLKKIDDIILTGPTKWEKMGGMLGMVLALADVKKSSEGSRVENAKAKEAAKEKRGSQQQSNGLTSSSQKAVRVADPMSLRFHGGPNLNYAIATARRFIFRTGMPLSATEHDIATRDRKGDVESNLPTWSDDKLLFWAMPLRPISVAPEAGQTSPIRPRKRSFHDMKSEDDSYDVDEPLSKRIVKQMFDSNWRIDDFVTMSLRDVRLPAAIFMRDPATGQKIQYTGPLPGGAEPVPDIEVMVRKPWPGALTDFLPSNEPSHVSVSYIIRNYPQRGKFQPDKAKALKVAKGAKWGLLSSGKTVESDDGREVKPEDVLAPGKQGSGIAVIDLPNEDYIDSLIARPEWDDAGVMDGIEAMIWLLGPGMTTDARIHGFRQRFSKLKHVVSSPESGTESMALESAVKTAWRNNQADDQVFPKLLSDGGHLGVVPSTTSGHGEDVSVASPGLRLILEPRFEIDTENCVKQVEFDELETEVNNDFQAVAGNHADALREPATGSISWPTEGAFRDIEVLTFGTGSSHPSTQRNVSATLLRVPGIGSYLLDCGEGTLGTLRRMYTKPQLDEIFHDLKMVWISHMHADHHLGLTSVIKTWYEAVHSSCPGSAVDTSNPSKDGARLAVVSDAPMLHWLQEFSNVEDFGYSRLLPLATKPTRFATMANKRTTTILRLATEPEPPSDEAFSLCAAYKYHMNIRNLSTVYVNHCKGAQAISFETNNGFRVSYSGDCRPSADFAAIGMNSHVLIHEATFEDDMRDEAFAKKHSTTGEALVVGSGMKAQSVVLTHFSQRYPKMPLLGVVPQQSRAPSPPRELQQLLEEKDSEDENTGAPLDGVSESLAPPPPVRSSSSRGRGGSARHNDMSHEYSTMIDAGSITKLIEESGMRVVMAFDYMRLRLGDLPRLERKQPLLRAMYDALDVKDAAQGEIDIVKKIETPPKKAVKGEKKKGAKQKPDQPSALPFVGSSNS